MTVLEIVDLPFSMVETTFQVCHISKENISKLFHFVLQFIFQMNIYLMNEQLLEDVEENIVKSVKSGNYELRAFILKEIVKAKAHLKELMGKAKVRHSV